MMLHQQNQVVLDLYGAAQTERVEDFGKFAIKSLMKQVRADSSGMFVFRFDELGQMFISSYVSHNIHPDKPRLRQELIGTEVITAHQVQSKDPLLMKALKHPNTAHTIQVNQHFDNDVYEYARVTGSMNAMTHFSTYGTHYSGINLWREKQADIYTAQEINTANLLMPHVRQSMMINQKLAADIFRSIGINAGFMVVEHQGQIHHIDDLAVILLRKEFPDWLSHDLPVQIMQHIGKTYVGKHITLHFRSDGGLFFIQISAKEPSQKLTTAELRVVEHVVKFGSYKEAARQLDISVSTVRNQLHTVYSKLGIHRKSDLTRFVKG